MRCIIPTREWVRVCVKHSNTRQKLWLKPKEQQIGACSGMAFAENLFNIKGNKKWSVTLIKRICEFASFFLVIVVHIFSLIGQIDCGQYILLFQSIILFFSRGAYERRAKNYRTFFSIDCDFYQLFSL